ARRRAAVAAYLDVLEGAPGLAFQQVPAGGESSWKDFSITVEPRAFGATRDAVRTRLAARGVESRAYYSPPCHRMPAFSRHHPADRPLAVTDGLAAGSLALPLGAHVTPAVARMVANEVLGCRA
ncbi:MAG: aminotransferase DegT, partial [Planctomycetia bacterium]|nr:aminotransferase DegT [Planctomycetia bacterium]